MIDPKNIKIQDYNYPLPDERIAKFPIAQRDHSKLLIYNKGIISHDTFCNISSHLPQGALLVYNNTKVIQARLRMHKETGALIEVFLLEPCEPCDYEQIFQTRGYCAWVCLVGNLKKWKEGRLSRQITVGNTSVTLSVERKEEVSTGHRIDFYWDRDDIAFADILEAIGVLPIPPYLNRETEESDKTTYQTVYSKIKGSVAAPTAGLHFTEKVLQDIDSKGIERQEVTLHVGAGTFKPVKSEMISGHKMHREYISVKKEMLQRLIAHDGQAIAVGTTSVRTLESLYYIGCKLIENPKLNEYQLRITQWEPYEKSTEATSKEALEAIVRWLDENELTTLHSSTEIIIAPGYSYHIVRMLITNFHQPKSTLLLLVSAMIGDDWHSVYDYALDNDFRFLSYGDSSLLIP